MRDSGSKMLAVAGFGLGLYAAARLGARRYRRMDFAGKVVVITGGSRGLGLLLARRFGAEGAHLVIASRDAGELRDAEADLRSRGVASVTTTTCNVRLREDVRALIRTAVETHGTVDVLVNNAGTIQVGPIEHMTERDYQEAMDVHFWGPLHAIEAVLPLMRARAGGGGGRIVNISSIGGKIGVPHLAPYCASKFALAGFSQSAAAELRKDNIYVTAVYPALIRTGSPRNALFKGRNEQEYTWFALGDSLPVVSQSAERAASRIVNACRWGEAELVTSIPAAVAVRIHAMFPWLSHEMSAAVDQVMLPAPGGIGTSRARGYESETPVTRSALTALTRSAAEANNEVRPGA